MRLRRKSDQDLLEELGNHEFWQALRESIVPGVRAYFERAIRMGMELAKTQRRKDLDADFLNRIVLETIDSYTDEWWGQLMQSQSTALREAIRQSRIDGSGVEGVINRVNQIFSPARAQTVAVTETTRLIGRGAQLQYQAAGYSEWEWQTANDPFVDPICAARNGQVYPITQPFEPAHPRCRCWAIPAGDAA